MSRFFGTGVGTINRINLPEIDAMTSCAVARSRRERGPNLVEMGPDYYQRETMHQPTFVTLSR